MKQLKLSVLMVLLTSIQACGVAIHSNSSVTAAPDYVTYSIYEVYSNNRTELIFSDCINLDRSVDDDGEVHIDTPYAGEDLIMSWENFAGDITFTFEDNLNYLYGASYDTFTFEMVESKDLISTPTFIITGSF